jgi:diketogulonate reductase-like aldo/keto reductase
MLRSIDDCVTLHNGVRMPWLGLGTWQTPPGRTTEQAIAWALEAGYRHVDTAALYANEESVGQAIRDFGAARRGVFVTTKVWNDDVRKRTVRQALNASLRKLGMNDVDLFLLHWPVPGRFVEAWRAMEDLLEEGKARAIGVSNFLARHLEDLLQKARVVPAVNQVEWHPWLRQPRLMEFCRKAGIAFQAWSPLMQGRVTEVPELAEIGGKHGKTAAQVTIRWGLQHHVVMIPKSVRRERIIENAAVFDFELSEEEMNRIDGLDRDQRLGPDPNDFDF